MFVFGVYINLKLSKTTKTKLLIKTSLFKQKVNLKVQTFFYRVGLFFVWGGGFDRFFTPTLNISQICSLNIVSMWRTENVHPFLIDGLTEEPNLHSKVKILSKNNSKSWMRNFWRTYVGKIKTFFILKTILFFD